MPYRKSAKPLTVIPRPSLIQATWKILKASWVASEAWWAWVMTGEAENGTPFEDYKALYIQFVANFRWPRWRK